MKTEGDGSCCYSNELDDAGTVCRSNVQGSLVSDFNPKWNVKVCSIAFNENALSSFQVCMCRLKNIQKGLVELEIKVCFEKYFTW